MAEVKTTISVGAITAEAEAGLGRVRSGLLGMGKDAESTTSRLSTTYDSLAGYIKTAVAAMATWKAAQYIQESMALAARVETLGAVMKVIGNNAGYTGSQMEAFTAGLKKVGITTQESMNSLNKMASAQIDLSKSSELARIAQNAASIGGINSSEAFGRMIQAISSGEVEILKTIGINVQFEQGYKKTAAQLGKTTAQLTAAEKTQSRMNEVLGFGTNISGAYEASMSTAGKQMLSMARYTEELKLAVGNVALPVLTAAVWELVAGLKNADSWMKDNKSTMSAWAEGILTTYNATKNIFLFLASALDGVGIAAARAWQFLLIPGAVSGNQWSKDQMSAAQDYIKMMQARIDANRIERQAIISARNIEGGAVDSHEAALLKGGAYNLDEQKRIAAGVAGRELQAKLDAKAATASVEKKAAEAHEKLMIAHSVSVIKAEWEKAALEISAEDFTSKMANKLGITTLGPYKVDPKNSGFTKNPAVSLGVDTQLQSLEQQLEAQKKLDEAAAASEKDRLDAAKIQSKIDKENAKIRLAAYDATAIGGMSNAIKKYGEDAADVGRQVQEAFARAFSNMEDALVSFAQTGKLSLGSLFKQIQADLIRMTIAKPITNMIAGGIQNIGSMFSGGGSSTITGTNIPVAAGTNNYAGLSGAGASAIPYAGIAVAAFSVVSAFSDMEKASQAAKKAAEDMAKAQAAYVKTLQAAIMKSTGNTNAAEMLDLATQQKTARDTFDTNMFSSGHGLAWASQLTSEGKDIGNSVMAAQLLAASKNYPNDPLLVEGLAQYQTFFEFQKLEIIQLGLKQDLTKNNLLLTEMELMGKKDTAEYALKLLDIQKAEMYGMDNENQIIQTHINLLNLQKAAQDKINLAIGNTVDIAISAATAIKDIQGGSLSIDSPEEKYRKAALAFRANTDASKAGELGKSFLTASQMYNASGAGYQSDYSAVMGSLQGLAGMGATATADRQLAVLESIRDALKDNAALTEQNKILTALLNVSQAGFLRVAESTEETAKTNKTVAQTVRLQAAA